ncbi:MAG TPA: pilin [bacterium]|nr:pilin [bacterium]
MKKFVIFLASLAMIFSFSYAALAVTCGGTYGNYTCPAGYVPQVENYGTVTTSDDVCTCVNMFGGEDVNKVGQTTGLQNTTLPNIIGNIVKAVLGLFGVVATVIIVYGGVKWMTSEGDTNKIDSAKKLMIAGAIGMVLVVSGYAITTFLINNVLMRAVGAV